MLYRGLQLDRFQEEAINHLVEGSSVLVSAPTGTGKTIIADFIVDEALRTGREVIYTAPIKALSNQKFRDYTRLGGPEKVGLVTGDLVIRRDAPCRVMTTEILRNMLLGGDRLGNLLAVILDEIHFLDDRERGTTWEEVLIYLPPSVQVVGLSATLSNLGELASWMEHVRGRKVAVVEEHKRTVPLSFHVACVDTGLVTPTRFGEIFHKRGPELAAHEPPSRGHKGHKGHKGRDRDQGRGRGSFNVRRTRHGDVFQMMRDEDMLPYLYFAFSRKDTEAFARDLARNVRGSLLDPADQARVDKRLAQAAGDIGAALDPELRQLYGRGIAFHHAGLHVQLKALVEELYEEKLIAVLYCTSTFALGINMPARSVVFDALKKYDGRTIAPLTTRQFMQKAGRAGRRGKDSEGHVVMRLDLTDWEEVRPQLERYKKGAYEPVHSSFNLSWNSVVNLLARHEDEHIRSIVDKSFLNWHILREAERSLERAEVLEENAGDKDGARKEAKRLRKRASKADDRCWQDFRVKVSFLQDIGYLAHDQQFNAGANVLQHLQISEIPVTELVLSGLLENLDMDTLFGVTCGLTNELPRGVDRNFFLKREDKRLANEIEAIVRSPTVTQAAEIAGAPWTWEPDLLVLGREWAAGRSLQELLLMVQSTTDISGDLITGFRRAKDLAGQLVLVYKDVPGRSEAIKELIRKVSRDEVEVVD